jgi:sigma-B regulation protein RsbU (phosphoserine phosphatase)
MLSQIPPEATNEVDDVLHTLGVESGMPTVLLTHVNQGSWSPWAVHDGGSFGLEAGRQIDATHTLCEVVCRSDMPLALDDARRDVRFSEHPASTTFGVAAYVGVPFRLPNGSVLGTLCALDRVPHVGLEEVLPLYRLFARLLAHEFQLVDVARTSLAALHTETETAFSRERFLAAVVHDLRTPLAAIEISAQLLRRQLGKQETGRGFERILDAASRMSRLIDDLLDFSRGRLGAGIPIARRPIDDTPHFLKAILEEVATAHPERHMHWDVQLEDPRASWDVDRIAQCLDNILTNACVHGAASTPVSVVVRGVNSEVTIDVVNFGELSAIERTSLFEPFHGPRVVRRGLGLGLFIADQIVRSHGGRIEVESVHGETRTRIHLPVNEPGN